MQNSTTTRGIASALVRAKNAGGITEGDLANFVNMLIDGAMALDVDAQTDTDVRVRRSSDLLGDLATAIEDAS